MSSEDRIIKRNIDDRYFAVNHLHNDPLNLPLFFYFELPGYVFMTTNLDDDNDAFFAYSERFVSEEEAVLFFLEDMVSNALAWDQEIEISARCWDIYELWKLKKEL